MSIPIVMMIAGAVMAVVSFVVSCVNMAISGKRMMNGSDGSDGSVRTSFGNMFAIHVACICSLGVGSLLAVAGLVWFIINKVS